MGRRQGLELRPQDRRDPSEWEREGKVWGCDQEKEAGGLGRAQTGDPGSWKWGQKERKNGGRLWGEEKGLARGHDVKNKEQGVQLTKC